MELPPEIEEELKELVFSPRNPYLSLDNLLRPYTALMLRAMDAQRERDAAYIEKRAGEIEAGQDATSVSAWVARIFREEADKLRSQP